MEEQLEISYRWIAEVFASLSTTCMKGRNLGRVLLLLTLYHSYHCDRHKQTNEQQTHPAAVANYSDGAGIGS